MAKEPHYEIKFAFKPYDLQQEIIDHMDGKILNPKGKPYRFFVAALGRQVGKSWFAKYTLLERANNRKQTCMWVAPAIPAARSHWKNLVALITNSDLPVKKISQAAKEIHFYGGGSISIRSAIEPDNIRGETLDYLVMDEAAFYREGEYVWWQVLMPMITASRGIVLMATTPNGRNWVYEAYKSGQDPANMYYKSWNFSSYISPYQDKELLDELKKTMPSLRWREEFMAEFLADGGGVFAGVEEASIVDLIKSPLHGHTYIAGIDFGFSNDNTCFTVVDKFTRQQVFGDAFTNVGTIRTMRRLVDLLNIWSPEVTHIEKNGIGESLFDLLRDLASGKDPEDMMDYMIERMVNEPDNDEFAQPDTEEIIGGHRLVAIHMDNAQKRALVEKTAAAIEYGRLTLLAETETPRSYGALQISEMSTYERKHTNNGIDITYSASEGAHDDTISALYIAMRGLPKRGWSLPSAQDEQEEYVPSPFKSRNRRKNA